jgi:hypothetical protein
MLETNQHDSIQFTVCSAIILLSTFIPKGAFAFNPKTIGDIRLQGEAGHESDHSSDGDSIHKEKTLAKDGKPLTTEEETTAREAREREDQLPIIT